jgi:hypothetical protein
MWHVTGHRAKRRRPRKSPKCLDFLGWPMGFEPTTTGITILLRDARARRFKDLCSTWEPSHRAQNRTRASLDRSGHGNLHRTPGLRLRDLKLDRTPRQPSSTPTIFWSPRPALDQSRRRAPPWRGSAKPVPISSERESARARCESAAACGSETEVLGEDGNRARWPRRPGGGERRLGRAPRARLHRIRTRRGVVSMVSHISRPRLDALKPQRLWPQRKTRT